MTFEPERDVTGELRDDFDRIAGLPEAAWNHNDHYHDFLLRHLPSRFAEALDIGCGTGAFSRALAQRTDHVLALDLSPQMIRVAHRQSAAYLNIDYEVADVIEWEFPRERFDCVACIATLHHLPLAPTLEKIKAALKPGGILLVLDLYSAATVSELLVAGLGYPASIVLRLLKNGRLSDPPEAQQAWAEHGTRDHYATLSQVRDACAEVLPGAAVRRHLLWRYSLVWTKPGGVKR